MVSKELLPSWLRLCNDRIVELLYALDVGNSDGETAKEVFNVLFDETPHKELVDNFCYLDPASKLVPVEKLTPETAVYWRNLTRFMYDEIEDRGVVAASPYLEQLLPELSQFCQYIRSFILNHNQNKNEGPQGTEEDEDDEEAKEVAWFFVAKQLIEMTSVFDLSDEMGRNNLAKLCREILLSRKVTADFVDPVMRIFTVVQNSPSSRIQEIAEIIAELREPLLLRDAEQQKDNDEGFGDGDLEDRLADDTLQSEFDAMENANKVLSKAEQVRHEEALRKKQVEMAKVRVKLNIMKHDLEEAIQDQDFVRAQQIKVDVDKLEIELVHRQEELTEAAAMAPVPSSDTRKDKINDKKQGSQPAQQPDSQVAEVEELNPASIKLDDPLIIHKSLKMLSVMLESKDIKSTNATLQTLLDEFVIPSIQNVDCHIRNSAVKAMGGCCLRSLDAAKRHLLLTLQIAHLDTPEVRITALNVIYDLLMWHGLPAFITNMNSDNDSKDDVDVSDMSKLHPDDELGTLESALDSVQGCRIPTQKQFETHGGNSVVAILSQLLDDPDIEIRTRVAEGLCKLLMCGSISSPKLFTRLILMWYNPITEADGKLRHILGTFFPLYASFSRANQDSIEESFMPTLKTLFDAPATSPLMEVDVEDVGMFYLSLTSGAMLQQPKNRDGDENGDIASDIGASVHDAMAYTLCNQIIASPDSFHVKTLIRLLLNLQITANNFVKIKELKIFHTQMTQAVRDKLSLKSLERFGMRIDEWLTKDPDLGKGTNEENITLDANPTQEQDKGVVAHSEDEQSANTTTVKKKRTLFTHDATTMLDLTRAVELESTADSDNGNIIVSESSRQSNLLIRSDIACSLKRKSSSEREIEASDKDILSSSGPSAHKGKGKNLSTRNEDEVGLTVTSDDQQSAANSSEGSQPPRKSLKHTVPSSEESEEEEVFSGNILRKYSTKPTNNKSKTTKTNPQCEPNLSYDNVFTSTQSNTMLAQGPADCVSRSESPKHKKPSNKNDMEVRLSPVKRRSSNRNKNLAAASDDSREADEETEIDSSIKKTKAKSKKSKARAAATSTEHEDTTETEEENDNDIQVPKSGLQAENKKIIKGNKSRDECTVIEETESEEEDENTPQFKGSLLELVNETGRYIFYLSYKYHKIYMFAFNFRT